MDAAGRDYIDTIEARGAARAPATFGEIWSSEWQRSGLETFGGVGAPFARAVDELADAVERAAGGDIAGYAAEKQIRLGITTLDQRVQWLNMLADTLPPEERDKIEPLRDPRAIAARRAEQIEREAADVHAATYGLSGAAVTFAAGVARQFVDPANMAANVLTAPIGFGAGTARFIAAQAFAGAVSQAAVEPHIQQAREELGLEAGAGRSLLNIGEAAFAGGGLAGLFRAGAWGARGALRVARGEPFFAGRGDLAPPAEKRISEAPAAPARPSVGEQPHLAAGIGSEDLEAVALLAERNRVTEEILRTAPVAPRQKRQLEIAAAIEAGRPPVGAPAIEGRGELRALIRADNGRIEVRNTIVELGDLTYSHDLDGVPNPAYPVELQPRDRAAPASRTWVAEKSAALEPALLGDSPVAGLGAPVIGPDGIVESGNGRALLLASAYQKHPERAQAYRDFLAEQGYAVEGFKQPVLVRVREGELPMSVRAALAQEANISPVAGMSVRERAFADARLIDENLMALYRGGDFGKVENAPFMKAFTDRMVAPEDQPNFVGADGRLSAAGVARVEAALVARAWGAEDIVAALYETPSPTSKAILGAFADTAPQVARLKAGIAEGRIAPETDPSPALLDAFRLVEAARAARLRVEDFIHQADIERGVVPETTAEAVRLYFRDDTLRQAAGREVVAERIRAATQRAIDSQNVVRDLFATPIDAGQNIRIGTLAATAAADQSLAGAERAALERMLDRNAPMAEIAAHPLVLEADTAARALPPTTKLEGYGTPEFQASRQLKFGDETVTGYRAGVQRLIEGARAFSTAGPVRNERQATIVLGPPAAGKSTLAERIARGEHAAIVDSDEAKKVLPEYDGGLGAPATHNESNVLIGYVHQELVREGANILLPRVGANAADIARIADELIAQGYTVNLVNMSVTADEAYRRMIRRFVRSGRIISSDYFGWVGEKPKETYYSLIKEGRINGQAADFDGNGPIGSLKVIDGADTRLAAYADIRPEPLSGRPEMGPGRRPGAVGEGDTRGAAGAAGTGEAAGGGAAGAVEAPVAGPGQKAGLIEPSSPHWHEGTRKALLDAQPFATLDEALVRAPANQASLVAAMREVAGENVKDPGIKADRARMEQKIAEVYDGDPRGLTDIVRAGATTTLPADADALVAGLAQRFRVIDEGWDVSAVGYFDRKLRVIFDDGMIGEVQMWPPAVIAAKPEGEKLYHQRRAAPAAARPALMELEKQFWLDVQNQVDASWASVIGGAPNRLKSGASDAAMASPAAARPSQPTSTALTGRQPSLPSAKAEVPSSDTAASVLPQANQRIAASTPDITTAGGLVEPHVPKGESLTPVGDPALFREFTRLIDEHGDFEITLENGSKRSARSAIAEAQADADTAIALEACIGEAALSPAAA